MAPDNRAIQERRAFTRIIFDAETQVHQGDHSWDAVLIDISLNGLLIEEPAGWNIDSTQPLTADIKLNDEVVIHMEMLWRHTENHHVGFQCEHIDLDSISHLRRLVELNIGNSALLERELAALGK